MEDIDMEWNITLNDLYKKAFLQEFKYRKEKSDFEDEIDGDDSEIWTNGLIALTEDEVNSFTSQELYKQLTAYQIAIDTKSFLDN
jgi:hypothetical protein